MPRKQMAAVAGRNLLFGPPGSPAPGFGGRGSPSARIATLSALTLGAVAEMLFEGAAGVDGVAFDEIRGNTVADDFGAGVIVLGGDEFSHHSGESIQFNKVDTNYVRVFTAIPAFFIFELWFRDNLTDGDAAIIVGVDNNNFDRLGRGDTVGFNFPSYRNDFNETLRWESEVDISGDGLIHQLLDFRDTVGGNNFIVCLDGMPVASGTTGGLSTQLTNIPVFNGNASQLNSQRFGGELGSFVGHNNGSNMTLRDARDLYETSALGGRDMLPSPRWFILDSANVVIPDPILSKKVDLGDVLNDTGVRSGAIPRSENLSIARKTYFELEIIDQGDATTGTLIGVRRFAEGGPVGGDSDNPNEAIYLKDGLLFDGANVQLPGDAPVGVESGAILDAQMTASEFLATWEPELGRLNGGRAWLQPNPQEAGEWLQVDLLQVRTIIEIKTQGNNLFNEWVISYKIEFAGEDLIFGEYNSGEILTGNTDRDSIVTNSLIPFQARYIRCLPETFQTSTSLRLEYTQAGDQDARILGDPITGRVYRFAMDWQAKNPTRFFIGDELQWKGTTGAVNPAAGIEFGVETVEDSQMTASSFFAVLQSPFEARLNNPSPLFWQPLVGTSLDEWWKVDFLSVKDIASVSTQGSSQGAARITSYRLEYNNDDSDNWIPYNFGEVLVGNVADSSTVVTNQLFPFSAQFVRLIPVAFTFGVNLRIEFNFDEQANPAQDRAGLGFLDTIFNWGAWLRTNGTSGNGKVRLRTKFYEMILPIPAGYDSWEPQSFTVETTPFGVNRRQAFFDFFPRIRVAEYLFEGTGVEYLLDRNDKKVNKAFVRDLAQSGGTAPTLGGLQLSQVSVDSVRWPRTLNSHALSPDPDPTVHAFEFWYRQPDFAQTQCCLIRVSNNNHRGIGRGDGTKRFPSFHNNFNAITDWESEVDLYGDNKSHCLFVARDGIGTNYRIYIDGMPIASGTNDSFIDNLRGFLFNGEQSNGVDELSRSGGDFGSMVEYKEGDRFTQLNVRKLYEASVFGTATEIPIGLDDETILDAQMTAKSFNPLYPASHGRLNDADHWTQLTPNDVNDWIQVDLLQVETITEVKSQGSAVFNWYVITFELEFSLTGIEPFTSYNSNEVLPTGSTSGAAVFTNVLIPFACRFIRLIPKSWNSNPAIRLEYIKQLFTPADMLTAPQWCLLDGVNTTVGGVDDKDATLADVFNDTGIRSYAIPRNGKVYFEVFIVDQGQATTAIRYGIRKLAEGGNVGNICDNAEDGYTQNSQFISDGLQATLQGQDNLTLETQTTGNTFQIAIDWDTGNWWFGDGTNYKGSGTPGSANPSTGTDPFGVISGVGPLDVNVNWACWIRNNSTLGNGVVRLVTAAADFAHTPPTGFVAWEDAI